MTMITLTIGGQAVELHRCREMLGIRFRSDDFAPRAFALGAWKAVAHGLGGFDLLTADGHADAGEALDALRNNPEVLCATHVYRFAADPAPLVPTGDLFVVFREDASHNACLSFLDSFFLKIKEIRGKNSVVAQVTALSPNPVQVALRAQADTDLVEICEPDLAFPLRWSTGGVPTDRSETMPIEVESRRGALSRVQAAREALGPLGAYCATIAVLDDGFELTHPDFCDRIHSPLDFDRHPIPTDAIAHGTDIARLALAHGPGSVARFMPVRAGWLCDSLFEKICDALIENGADALNCSWGFPGGIVSARIREAVARLAVEGRRGRGTVAVFSADCGAESLGRTALPEVLSVGCFWDTHNSDRALRNGREISMVAQVSELDEADGPRVSAAAAPIVAGAVAMVLSVNPDLTSQEVKLLLQSTADRIGRPDDYDSAGRSERFGHGLLNVHRAVVKARGMTGLGRLPFVDMPPILPKATAHGSVSSENPTKLYQISFGNQLIVKTEARRAGLDLGLFLRKKEVPRPSVRAFDKLGRFQNGSVVLVQNDIEQTDQFLMVRAQANQGPYDLQVALAGTGKQPSVADSETLRGCTPLKFQTIVQAELARAGESHLYRLSLAPRLLARLRVRPTAIGTIALYFRQGGLPDPIGAHFDAAVDDPGSNESGLLEMEFEAPALQDGFFMVHASDGFEGNFDLEVQLGI